jgi:hypothetical protein
MKKMLMAVACLSLFDAASVFAVRRVEDKPSTVEDLIMAIDKLSNVDKRLGNIKLFMADAKVEGIDPLEKAYNLVKVLEIVYDAVVIPAIGVVKGTAGINIPFSGGKTVGSNAKVKHAVDVLEKLEAQLKDIPEIEKELANVVDERAKQPTVLMADVESLKK